MPGDAPIDASLIEPLEEAFEIIRLDDPAQLERILAELSPRAPADTAALALQHIGEGAAVVDAAGTVSWCNDRLSEYDQEVRRKFAELCLEAMDLFNAEGSPRPAIRRASRKFSFACADSYFQSGCVARR